MGTSTGIYNPWSIINFIARKANYFKSYWGNTSSDDIIRSSITAKDAEYVRSQIEQLINGQTIVKYLDENIIFSDFYDNPDIFWSLLTFSGYLTPVARLGLNKYEIRIPNYEIRVLFSNIILGWLTKDLKIFQSTLRNMVSALTENRFAEFETFFKKVMGDTFSYFDTNTEPERVYQAYVLGLLGVLFDDFIIKSNRESGKGRYDILLLPRRKDQYGIIMELKQLDKNASVKQAKTTVIKALNQIKNNAYHQELAAHAVKEWMEIAIVFVGKEARLGHRFFGK